MPTASTPKSKKYDFQFRRLPRTAPMSTTPSARKPPPVNRLEFKFPAGGAAVGAVVEMVSVVLPVTPLSIAEMVDVPVPTVEASPLLLMVATPVVPDAQVT